MITTLPYSTAEIIGTLVPRKTAGPGIVEKRLDEGVYVISCAAGKVTVKVSSGSLSEGDAVNITQRGNELVLQKMAPQASSGAPALKDAVDVNGSADPATLRLIVDTVVDQLKKRVLDKPTLDQLQRILATVSKTPAAFDEDTQKAVSQLKSIVSSMPSRSPDISQAAAQITDRIIALGEKLGQKLKSAGGAVDIVLKSEASAKEGYYKFDSVKNALSWIAENKELNAEIPWQKLSATFKDGPVVLKVYESAIGDLRASLVSPDKVDADIEHFIQSNLKADIWKNIPGSVLVNLLSDRKEIPLERLLQIDKLFSAYDRSRPGAGIQVPQEAAAQGNVSASAPKGLETAFGQWLAIALDKNSPVEALIERAPAPAPPRLIDLLRQIDASRQNAGVTSAGPVGDEDVALSRSTVIDAQRPETVIIDLFRRLGLDLESALLKRQSTSGPDEKAQNLKEMLLSLQNAIDSAASKAQTPDTPKVAIDNKAALLDIAAKLDELAQSVQLAELAKDLSAQIRSVTEDSLSSLDNTEKVIIRLLFGERAAQTVSKEPASPTPVPQTPEAPPPQETGAQAPSIETAGRSIAALIEQAVGAGPSQIASTTKEIPAALSSFQKELAAALQKLFPQSQEGKQILDLLKPFLETATRLNVTARTQADALPAAAEKLSQGIQQILAKAAVTPDTEAAGTPSPLSASAAETAVVVQSRFTKTSDQLEKLIQDLSRGLAKLPDAVAANAAKISDGDTQAPLANLVKDGTAQILALLKGLSEQVQTFKADIPAQAQTMQRKLEQLATILATSEQSNSAASTKVPSQENGSQASFAKDTFERSVAALIEQAVGAGPAQIASITKEIPAALSSFQKELAAALQKLFPQSQEGRGEIRQILDMLKPLLETATRLNVTARAQTDALPAAAEKLSQGIQQFVAEAAAQADAGEIFTIGIPSRPSASAAETAAVVQSRLTKTSDQLEKLIQDLSRGLAKFPDAVAANAAKIPDADTQASLANLVRDGTAQILDLLKGLSEQVRAFKADIPAQAQTMQRQLEQLVTNAAVFSQDGPGLSQNLLSEAKNILDAMARDIGRQMVQNKIQSEEFPFSSQSSSPDDSPFIASMRRLYGLRADTEASIMQITKECSDKLKELIENVSTRLLQLQSGPRAQAGDIEKLAHEFSDKTTAIVTIARQEILKLFDQYAHESARPADTAPTVKEIIRQMQDLGTGTAQQLAAKVKDVTDLVQDFARQIAAGEDRLPKEIAARTTGQTKQAEIELLTKNILRQLDGLAKSLADQAGQARLASRDIARQFTDLAAQTTKLAEKLPQDAGRQTDRGPLDSLKQQVEQVLTRVESMQVLAKQVSFSDGQQQVISLPMKIEGQWTDVVVKFLKRKGTSEKEPSKKNVSVVIHVAPTILGEITVFMDYNGKKNFAMSMEFEKASSRRWFENNRAEFSKAIGKFGFPSFTIDMKASRHRQPADTMPQTASPATGTIDIKA